MRTPGGGAPIDFQALGTGTFVSSWIPAGAVVLALVLLLVAGCRSAGAAPGFAIYAVGSNRDAAVPVSGVNVGRTRDRWRTRSAASSPRSAGSR